MKTIVYVIRTTSGHWGKGSTLDEAKEKALKAGARKTERAYVSIVISKRKHPIVTVDQMGFLKYPADSRLTGFGTRRLGWISNL